MSTSPKYKHLSVGGQFIDLADYPREEVNELVKLAKHLEHHPEPRALLGKILGLVFFNPSLRTLASFQAAMLKLGGHSVVITPGQGTWGLETRLGVAMNGANAEHIREGLPVLTGYFDALAVRAFADGKNLDADSADSTFTQMTELASDKPFINMESAINHPCQALADWKTLEDAKVERHAKWVLSWVPHPRPLPLAVPSAALTMAAQRGHEVIIARPEGFALPDAIMAKARHLAALAGGSVTETTDQAAAFKGAQIIYAKEWGATERYGDAEHYQSRVATLMDWQITSESFNQTASSARLMHCLPVRRNVAVHERVLDSDRSLVIPQAHNRLWAQMAVLHRLLGQSFS